MIRISDGGGLSGFGTISVEHDTAEVMLEALAKVLGAKVDFGWAEKEPDAEVGSITVTNTAFVAPESAVDEFYRRWNDGVTEQEDLLTVAYRAIEELRGGV